MSELLKFLDTLKESDLLAIQKEIENAQNRLNSLRKMEKVIASRLGKEEPKKIKKEFNINNKRRIIAEYLSNGPKNGAQIITNCKIAPAKLNEIMDCSYFTKSQQGYHLTPVGRNLID